MSHINARESMQYVLLSKIKKTVDIYMVTSLGLTKLVDRTTAAAAGM